MVEVNLWISCYQIPPFFIFELQSKWIAGVLSNRFALPSQDEMMEDVKAMYSLLEASGTPKRYTHNIADHHVSAVSLLLLFLVNRKFSLFGFLPMLLITFNSYICTYQEGYSSSVVEITACYRRSIPIVVTFPPIIEWLSSFLSKKKITVCHRSN